MPSAKRVYRQFYLDGRADILDNSVDAEIDLKPLVEQVFEGASVYQSTFDAAKAALAPLWNSDRAEYLSENKAEITAAGGDTALAFDEYMAGRTDELRKMLEDSVVDAMHDEIDADDDDEDDEDEDEEDEEDDDEDDDDDDDDEVD